MALSSQTCGVKRTKEICLVGYTDTVRAPVFGRHLFFGTSEHYGKTHGSLLSGWMNYNYTACCWFPTSSNILILSSQFWQIRFESCWLHCLKCRILVLLRYLSRCVRDTHWDRYLSGEVIWQDMGVMVPSTFSRVYTRILYFAIVFVTNDRLYKLDIKLTKKERWTTLLLLWARFLVEMDEKWTVYTARSRPNCRDIRITEVQLYRVVYLQHIHGPTHCKRPESTVLVHWVRPSRAPVLNCHLSTLSSWEWNYEIRQWIKNSLKLFSNSITFCL